MTDPNEPRLPLVSPADYDDDQAEVMTPLAGFRGRPLNLFSTLVHHPKLLKRWRVFGTHVLMKSTLPPRDRELLILRTAWNCQAAYEWSHHAEIGREAALTDEQIRRVTLGPDAPGWTAHESALLSAADELHDRTTIGDETWEALAATYTVQQMLDLIFCVGQYHVVAMALNSLRVPMDEGAEGFPADPS